MSNLLQYVIKPFISFSFNLLFNLLKHASIYFPVVCLSRTTWTFWHDVLSLFVLLFSFTAFSWGQWLMFRFTAFNWGWCLMFSSGFETHLFMLHWTYRNTPRVFTLEATAIPHVCVVTNYSLLLPSTGVHSESSWHLSGWVPEPHWTRCGSAHFLCVGVQCRTHKTFVVSSWSAHTPDVRRVSDTADAVLSHRLGLLSTSGDNNAALSQGQFK